MPVEPERRTVARPAAEPSWRVIRPLTVPVEATGVSTKSAILVPESKLMIGESSQVALFVHQTGAYPAALACRWKLPAW